MRTQYEISQEIGNIIRTRNDYMSLVVRLEKKAALTEEESLKKAEAKMMQIVCTSLISTLQWVIS